MFYDRFIKLCGERGIAPTRAAIDAGLSKSTVTKWKNSAESEPSGMAIKKLADYFGITRAELLGEQKEKPAKKADLDDNDIKFALFGTTDVDDETLEDIKAYARFKREQRKE